MTKIKIGEATVVNGRATTSYTIPGDAATGQHTLTSVFLQNNNYKRGEGSTTLSIRIRTAITVYDVIASHGETATFSAKVTHTGNQNLPANAGQVQFQLGGVNIGSPVNVGNNGMATLQYTIPTGTEDGASITANFIQNNTYAGSNSTSSTLNIRAATNVYLENEYHNRGDEIEIICGVLDNDEESVTTGTCKLYIDNQQISTGTVGNDGIVTFSYTIPSSMQTGTHTLRVDYLQNDDYDAGSGSAILVVRMPTILTPVNVSGNAETTQESVPVTVTVKDENNNTVQSGSVGITIGSQTEVIIAVNSNGEATTNYTIPSNATGTINFTARFIQDNNYQASTMSTNGIITIRKGTIITMDAINAIRGDTVTLTANIKDNSNNNVTTGTVEFELE